jgi:hypothetical protein
MPIYAQFKSINEEMVKQYKCEGKFNFVYMDVSAQMTKMCVQSRKM